MVIEIICAMACLGSTVIILKFKIFSIFSSSQTHLLIAYMPILIVIRASYLPLVLVSLDCCIFFCW
mgnify:CR=1 FL=1